MHHNGTKLLVIAAAEFLPSGAVVPSEPAGWRRVAAAKLGKKKLVALTLHLLMLFQLVLTKTRYFCVNRDTMRINLCFVVL